MSYLGYVSRLAYLEATRQVELELAEIAEHRYGEGNYKARKHQVVAARLLEQIRDEHAKERTNASP